MLSNGWPSGSGSSSREVALAGNVWVGGSAVHADDHIGPFDEVVSERLWRAVGQVDPDFAHRLDDLGVHSLGWGGPGRAGFVPPVCGNSEESLADL